jgi:hypothetical protein
MLRCIVLVYILLKLYILDHFQWRFYHFIGRFLEILLEILYIDLSPCLEGHLDPGPCINSGDCEESY